MKEEKKLTPEAIKKIKEILSGDCEKTSVNFIYGQLKKLELINCSYPTFQKHSKSYFSTHKNSQSQTTPLNIVTPEEQLYMFGDSSSTTHNKPSKEIEHTKPKIDNTKLKNIKEDISILMKRTDALKSDIKQINVALDKISKQIASNDITTIATQFLEYINKVNGKT